MNLSQLNFSLDTLKLGDSVESFSDQCGQVIKEFPSIEIPSDYSRIKNVVVSGMGGSALGGRVVSALTATTSRVPILVSTEYHLPEFVDSDTLLIISSYSGNTEETLASLEQALLRKAKLFIITTGGKLAEISSLKKIPSYIFNPLHNPSGQPRMSLGYSILALVALLAKCGVYHPDANYPGIPEFLAGRRNDKEKLLDIAVSLSGHVPVLVASSHLKGAAHCTKNQINENAKNYCDLYDLPELNHHLLEGLAYPKSNPDNLMFLFFNSDLYDPSLQIRYPLTSQVVRNVGIKETTLAIQGPDALSQALDLVQSGSYIGYYLSLLNGVDPGPIPWVDWYKNEIRKMV